ncbi:hypothetical protein WJX73_007058 [Symbiochloris irregularis]|uniref:mannan endo-1,4-beta-mannosidase n=1 Tax=Symbiochloris irregularis TaxID=706552 RepID=A0AAW1P1L6_9CHLO
MMRFSPPTVLLAAAVLLMAGLATVQSQTQLTPDTFKGFISVASGRFVDEDCAEYPVIGFNGWELMESAAGVANFSMVGDLDAVEYTFSQAAKDGQTTVRIFAHGINSTLPLQPSAGVYDERAFAGLDSVLDTAAQYGVRLIMTMSDYWLSVDSFNNYVDWADLQDNPDAFFWDQRAMTLFKNHMNAMANRRNTVNGLLYKDDPTILAWDLMNEVRCDCFPATLEIAAATPACQPQCADNVTNWVNEMATYLHTIDPNHMVTVGEEGYWAVYDYRKQYNPGNGWAQITGQNFSAQHSPASIDFAAIHFWPDLWEINQSTTFDVDAWFTQHQQNAQQLGKPLILEEFGKNVTLGNGSSNALEASIQSQRAPVFQMIYGLLSSSLSSGGPLRGVMFWQWGMSPDNSDSNNIEVAAHDVDYVSIVVPAATSALTMSKQQSPIAGCAQKSGPVLAGNSTVSGVQAAG